MARFYLSTDDGAPVVAGNDRTSMVRLLKKCLIDGYGSKTPAGGWTMPFVNAEGTQAAFRNDSAAGTGFFLGIDAAGTSSPYRYKCIGYEDMTGAAAGVFPFPRQAVELFAGNTSSAVPRPWVVVATGTWVLVVVYNNASAMPTLAGVPPGNYGWQSSGFFFGDVERHLATDAYACMLSVIYSSAGFGYTASGSNASSTQITYEAYWFARRAGGAGSSAGHYGFLPHPCIGARCGTQGPAYTLQSGLLVGKLAFNDAAVYTLRGWLPEALIPLHPRPFEHLETVDIDGKTYRAVVFAAGGYTDSNNLSEILFEAF